MAETRIEQNYRSIERMARLTREGGEDPSQGDEESILSAVKRAALVGGKGHSPEITLGPTADLILPEDILAPLRELLSSRGYRPEGITALPLDRRLTAQEYGEIRTYFDLSYERSGVVDLERIKRIFPDQKLYHATNGLSYALQRQVGWLSPEDIAFVAQEICQLPDFLEIDPGFFMGSELSWVAGYAQPWPKNRPNDLLAVLKIDTTDPRVRKLMNTGILLEVDIESYREQLPDTQSFVVRHTDINRTPPVFEVIAPIAPREHKIRAVLDFNR
jgi:hypothetical protein